MLLTSPRESLIEKRIYCALKRSFNSSLFIPPAAVQEENVSLFLMCFLSIVWLHHVWTSILMKSQCKCQNRVTKAYESVLDCLIIQK